MGNPLFLPDVMALAIMNSSNEHILFWKEFRRRVPWECSHSCSLLSVKGGSIPAALTSHATGMLPTATHSLRPPVFTMTGT